MTGKQGTEGKQMDGRTWQWNDALAVVTNGRETLYNLGDAWPVIVALEQRVADLQAQLTAAHARIKAFEEAWALPPQGVGQVVIPSAGEVAANAVEEAKLYRKQLTAAVQERDSATRNLQLLISENLNERIPALEAAEAKAQRYREALEALAKVQYDGTVEGLRYQIDHEDWGDVLDIEGTKAAYELTLAALADTAETGA